MPAQHNPQGVWVAGMVVLAGLGLSHWEGKPLTQVHSRCLWGGTSGGILNTLGANRARIPGAGLHI